MKFRKIVKCLSVVLGITVVSIFLSGFTPNTRFDDLVFRIRKALDAKGCNTDSIHIGYVEDCSVNARVIDSRVEICSRFFGYEFRDQVSIVWHEIFHLNNDKPWNKTPIILDQIEYIQDVPSHITSYINDVMNSDLEFDYSKQIAYDRLIGLREIRDTVYYQNEIEAYRNEISEVTDVSPEYDAERKFVMWKHSESLKIANKYYRSQIGK